MFNPTRFARDSSAAIVAGIAGYASYWHQVSVTTLAGERAELAHIIPFSVDGMLVVASIVMVDDRQSGRKPRTSARLFFALGIVASVAANVASAHPTWLGRLVAAWPAIALLAVVEMLSRKGRRIAETLAQAVVPGSYVVPSEVATIVDEAATSLPVPTSPAPAGPRRYHRSSVTAQPRREATSPLTGNPLG